MYTKKDDLIKQIVHWAVLGGHELTPQQIDDLSRLTRKQLVKREALIISGFVNAIYSTDDKIEVFHNAVQSDVVNKTNLALGYAKSL